MWNYDHFPGNIQFSSELAYGLFQIFIFSYADDNIKISNKTYNNSEQICVLSYRKAFFHSFSRLSYEKYNFPKEVFK